MPPGDSSASTRDRILAYLREHRQATAQAISLAWGLTRADIRYHLNELTKEGLVEVCPRTAEPDAPRGRPVLSYRLAAQSAPNNYTLLCRALLVNYRKSGLSVEEAVKAIAETLVEGYLIPTNATRRYNQAVTMLNTMQYHARWEARARGPQIVLRTCPYAALLPEFPELCQMDHALLEKLFQCQVEQTAKVNLVTGNPAECLFKVSSG